jgi:ATP-dependent protease HslVU (ClpYQ) peptidase subunit
MLKNELFKTHYEKYRNRHDKSKIISFIDGKAEEVLH